MEYRLREIETENKFCQELHVEAINRLLPTESIEAALAVEKVSGQQVRKMDLVMTVLAAGGGRPSAQPGKRSQIHAWR